MPFTLTRSILVVIIPGLIALAPWALWVASKIPQFGGLYSTYATLVNASLIGVGIIIGSFIEGAMSHLEVKWDTKCEEQYKVRDNWFDYLAQQFKAEPVGFRYISRLATTMYFELSMMAATPIALLGFAILIYDHSPFWRCIGSVGMVLFALGSIIWFCWQAKCTHKVLCEARKELNERINKIR